MWIIRLYTKTLQAILQKRLFKNEMKYMKSSGETASRTKDFLAEWLQSAKLCQFFCDLKKKPEPLL